MVTQQKAAGMAMPPTPNRVPRGKALAKRAPRRYSSVAAIGGHKAMTRVGVTALVAGVVLMRI